MNKSPSMDTSPTIPKLPVISCLSATLSPNLFEPDE